LLLRGVLDGRHIRHANIKRANALSEIGGLTEDDLRRKYKVILSNPPFAGVLPKESIRQDLPTQSRKSELLFLGIMMEALAPGGRCAVILPEGLLFGSTSAHADHGVRVWYRAQSQGSERQIPNVKSQIPNPQYLIGDLGLRIFDLGFRANREPREIRESQVPGDSPSAC